ncbi:MAG: 50S ribosomal protein L15 [Candidatus Gracilibacteria bacterium]|jgi:large subunit ribosomal protein L15
MQQNSIKPSPRSTANAKRRGRGQSGGNYSGRGMKGQGSRSGSGVRGAFEGGQTPLVRRMPKLKGFKNAQREFFIPLNLDQISEKFSEGETVDVKTLKEKNIIKKAGKIKLLGDGELKVKVTIVADSASASAIKKAEKAGATLTIPGKKEKTTRAQKSVKHSKKDA